MGREAPGVWLLSRWAGDAAHPGWLKLRIATGGFTLNSGASVAAYVVAPSGTATLNATLTGSVVADRLTINKSGKLK